MNAFVRDGAVNRKRRVRQGLSQRNSEPERKKIYKTHDDGATPVPHDLASSALQTLYSGESSDNQSKVLATEKESSRYSNVEFIRAKAFLYLNYKKISSFEVNKLLREHLKKFDGNETHLKRIFEQCYDLTGSVEISKAMMKQLATNVRLRLDLTPKLYSGLGERRLSILPSKVVEKTDKKLKKIKDKKGINIRLKKNVDHQNLKMFGEEYSSADEQILYTNKVNDYLKKHIIDHDSDTTIISDDEEIGSCMRLTKSYSLHNTKINTFEVTPATKPNTCIIVRINSNLRKNNPQSNTNCAKRSISATNRLKTSVRKKIKKSPNVCSTENSKISASNMNNLGEIHPQLNTDAIIQNSEIVALETVNYVPQYKIDGIVENSKVTALETIVEGENTVPRKNSEGPVLVQNIDDEEMMDPPLIIDEEFDGNAEITVLGTDVEQIIVPQYKNDGIVENSKVPALEIIVEGENSVPRKNSEGPVLVQIIDDEEMMDPPLIIDEEFDENAESTVLGTDVEQIIVPQYKNDGIVENSKVPALEIIVEGENSVPRKNSEGPVLVQIIDDEEMMDPPLIIDEEFDENAENTVLGTDVEQIIVPQYKNDGIVENSKVPALEIIVEGENSVPRKNSEGPVLVQNIDDEEMMDPPLIIDEEFDENAESTVLGTDVEQIIVPQYKNDGIVESSKVPALEIIVEGENSVPRKNSEGPVLVQNIYDGEMMVPPLIIDEEFDENAESTVLGTDVEQIIVPQYKNDGIVENSKVPTLEVIVEGENSVPRKNSEGPVLAQNIDDEEMTVPSLIIDEEFDENAKSIVLGTDVEQIIVPIFKIDEIVKNSKVSALETIVEGENTVPRKNSEGPVLAQNIDDEEITVSLLIIDTFDENAKRTVLEKYHTNLVLKIKKIINTDDEVFKNSIIKDLATYFLNDDFLSKVDALWKTTESDLVGELIINLLNMFNDVEYNMAQFTGSLICIFREIAQKSSIRPCQFKLKLIMFLDAIKKYIKFHDNALWRNWFLPSMFFDWCFIVAFIFMNTKNEFKIDLNESVLRNATTYYKMVKKCSYLFINQDLKPSKSYKKSGIFELTRIDDLLEIDNVHATNDTKVIPNVSINIPSNELKHKKLKMDDNCMDTINHNTPGNIEEIICPVPVHPKVSKLIVRSQFNYSNSFINKLNWFNGNVSELMKKFTVSTSNENIESSIVQNNTTVVGKNKVPSSVNKRRCATNEPTKSKKSKTQVESPRVFFTIANNPKEFDITYGSSTIAQKSSSSSVSENVSSSSTGPKNSSSSVAVPQSLGSSTVSQNVSPYYNPYSSSNTSGQLPRTFQTVVSRSSLSKYYNNITSNITQAPIGLQTMPSLSNNTQSSDVRNTNPSVNKNITSIIHSSNEQGIHHQSSAAMNSQLPRAANTWPSNKYTSVCSDPSCSKSSTHTQYTKSTSYSQLPNNYNIPLTTSLPQYSNALTYPTTFTNPLLGNILASDTARVASMNTYMQQQNYNYFYSSQNNLKTPEHNTQVSPDLPDARLPNMPNHQAADTINQRCMAANCTNFSSFSCNTCLAAFYCSIQCQKSDWHYHQNECCVSF